MKSFNVLSYHFTGIFASPSFVFQFNIKDTANEFYRLECPAIIFKYSELNLDTLSLHQEFHYLRFLSSCMLLHGKHFLHAIFDNKI